MVALVIILTILLLVPLFIWSSKQMALWRQALGDSARALGISYSPGTTWKAGFASGTLSDLPIKIDSYTVSTGKSSTTYTRIVVQTHLPATLALESEGLGLKRLFLGEDRQVGDEDFDQDVAVRGDELEALARLSSGARKAVRAALAEGARLKNREFSYVRGGLIRDAARLEFLARTLITAAKSLEIDDTFAGLARNVRDDDDAGVRLTCLQAIAEHFGGERKVDVARQALKDRDPLVRVMAARIVNAAHPDRGDEEAAQALCAIVDDGQALPKARAAALQVLQTNQAALPGVESSVRGALNTREPSVVGAALAATARLRYQLDVSLLGATLEANLDEAGLQSLARLLARYPNEPRAEAHLKRLLADDMAEAVRIAACTALGAVGGVETVEALLPLTKGMFRDGDLKEAARGAVAAIQGRLRGADAGQLSLAAVAREDGGLSVAQNSEAGGLSQEVVAEVQQSTQKSRE